MYCGEYIVKYLNKQGEGKIDWCDVSWNPIVGCYNDCEYCYVKTMNKRFGRDMTPKFYPERLEAPYKLKKPSKIFVVSAGDLFGEWVDKKWIEAVIKVARENPRHIFQFLTKNPKRYGEFEFTKNCWLGTTIDGLDKTSDNLFGLIEGTRNPLALYDDIDTSDDNLIYVSFEPLLRLPTEETLKNLKWVDWIIIGGKTGAKPFQPPKEWVGRILEEAEEYEIPAFIKDNAGHYKRIKNFPSIY